MRSTASFRLCVRLMLICGLCLCTGCLSSQAMTEGTRIRNMLERQAKDWNAGDIDAFMEAYWKSPRLTFSSGGEVTRGWDKTLENYKKRYPTKDDMGYLKFSHLYIDELGEDHAMVLGRWYLRRDEPVGGSFTLVLRKFGKDWRIIHDHTSRDSD